MTKDAIGTTPAPHDYFAASSNRTVIDEAASILAIVNNRSSPTRPDYAHPRFSEIFRILETSPKRNVA